MDNRLVHLLEGYIDAIFKDMRPCYGTKSCDWERDRKRSLHELGKRGVRFLTIDLPAHRKHLDRCLDEGLYTPSALALSSLCSKRVQVPAFLRVLYLQIFNEDGLLRIVPCVESIAKLRQFFEGFGKLKEECHERYTRDEVRTFVQNDEGLRAPTADWASYHFNGKKPGCTESVHFRDGIYTDLDHRLDLFCDDGSSFAGTISAARADYIQRVCDWISSSLGDLHVDENQNTRLLPRHGPGRVSNLRKDQSKFSFSDWPSKLDRVFPYDLYGCANLLHIPYCDENANEPRNHESHSKLIAVPKTATGPRLIGSEPNYNVWIQQLIRLQLEAAVERTCLRHCISFGDQGPNQVLAREGSITGSFATVDLKSASDRLSCWTIERVFRANLTLLDRLQASRTSTMRNAIDDHFDIIMLKKCFTQGNACTFPVQTIVYSMLSIACSMLAHGMPVVNKSNIEKHARKVRVFGDDIIISKEAFPYLLETLSFLQLKVNLSKTFLKGKFRESCGLDCYDGVDVTPARVKRISCKPSHETLDSLLQASNNFWKKGYWNVSNWIVSRFLDRKVLPVVGIHDSAGLCSFLGASVSHLKSRYNQNLHRTEYRVQLLGSKTKKVPTQSAHDLFEFLHTGNRPIGPLDHLDPLERELGVVHKQSSVMKTGWRFIV